MPDSEPPFPRIDEDLWGTRYVCRFAEEEDPHVRSAGPDGRFDTEDDIRWP